MLSRLVCGLVLAACSACTALPPAPPVACVPVRDETGRIARSREAVRAFRVANPCPATGKGTGACPGYVVDHIHPLCDCGPDRPDNMQWQTVAAAKEKDQWERRICRGVSD